MDANQVAAATQALVDATKATAVSSGQEIDANQQQLAPGLNSGQNAPGGYNYARNVAPVVDPLTANLVIQAKQAVLRSALKDATNTANNAYVDAQNAYQGRQRAFNVKQAEMQRDRQRKQDAINAAALAGTQGNGLGDTNVVNTDQFVGNNDYRGRLNWLAQNSSDGNIKNAAATALKYVGNDMKFKLNPYVTNPAILNALKLVGATNVWTQAPTGGTLPNLGGNKINTADPANVMQMLTKGLPK